MTPIERYGFAGILIAIATIMIANSPTIWKRGAALREQNEKVANRLLSKATDARYNMLERTCAYLTWGSLKIGPYGRPENTGGLAVGLAIAGLILVAVAVAVIFGVVK